MVKLGNFEQRIQPHDLLSNNEVLLDARIPSRVHETIHLELAVTNEQKSASLDLIHNQYSKRGYSPPLSLEDHDQWITFIAAENSGQVIGTISVRPDTIHGLFADETYQDHLNELRQQGNRLSEFGRLALRPVACNRHILSELFYLAYLYLRTQCNCSMGVLEINPRHAKYYEKKLGLYRIGPLRHCTRVSAPSVLMSADFPFLEGRVKKQGYFLETAWAFLSTHHINIQESRNF
jgi:hypothetical protein